MIGGVDPILKKGSVRFSFRFDSIIFFSFNLLNQYPSLLQKLWILVSIFLVVLSKLLIFFFEFLDQILMACNYIFKIVNTFLWSFSTPSPSDVIGFTLPAENEDDKPTFKAVNQPKTPPPSDPVNQQQLDQLQNQIKTLKAVSQTKQLEGPS